MLGHISCLLQFIPCILAFYMKKAFLLIVFCLEVMFWHMLTPRLANLMYGSILAIFSLPVSAFLGMPPIYLSCLAVLATFL